MTVSITLANATTRTTVITDDSKQLSEVLAENNMPTSGVTFHIDGVPSATADKTLAELNVKDGSMVVTVPAQKAGC